MRDFVDWPDANDQAASRAVLSWRQYGAPKIFNTDQGSQFTSTAFTGVLVAVGIAISMDGRGRWMDNEALGC